ncbi:hypothetical protein [Anaerotardibacter muris]|uniref:hypothetical protein n=1 Tax=Anaerotardibacter muris TaxID=2941505 RepID=UPI00204163D5|nr:hypothetical protein [Anaerotardibacter muris]
MGLDATVRCDCFEKGLMRPCPVDIADIYVDGDGYLASRTLDEASRALDFRRFLARYERLEEEIDEWARNGCSHESGELCSERVGNIAACAHFKSLVKEVGGEEEFPYLSKLLPYSNGGIYPVEKALKTLEELNRFIDVVSNVNEWVLCDMETEEEVWSCTTHASFVWMLSYDSRIGMAGDRVFFAQAGKPVVETTHFKQIPIGHPDNQGCQPMRIVCLDTGAETYSFDSIGPDGSKKIEREFYVASKKAPFLFEGKYWMAERIKNLLIASIQSGNPIRWC